MRTQEQRVGKYAFHPLFIRRKNSRSCSYGKKSYENSKPIFPRFSEKTEKFGKT